MGKKQVEYKINGATQEDVYAHLIACNANFVPFLTERIDISGYAKKIAVLSVTFEAWFEGILVGLIAAYFNDPKGRTAFITNVSVVKGLMGEGIASELLKKCVNYGIEKRFTEICLEVNKENHPAISFYRKFNFLQDSIKDDCVVMKKNV